MSIRLKGNKTMTILDEIAGKTRERIEVQKRHVSEQELKAAVREFLAKEKEEKKCGDIVFEEALAKEGMSFICE